tara:strand:- start:740 stop:2383 length:1644 start_codon:yes stop_codon:yes gene_type:complete
MQIFDSEKSDGLEEILKSSASLSYASLVEPCQSTLKPDTKHIKSIAAVDDKDLYYVQSILVTSSWNKNDDVFDKAEIWKARSSPEDKPTNLEHDENVIIGHITSNWPITVDGILIDTETPIDNLPEKYHILTGSVIYRGYSSPELRARSQKLIDEIENGSKYVSMECFFKGFDYGLFREDNNEFKVLARNADTSYLTKFLRAYGGEGRHGEYKIGRVLKDITFSGKGFVDKPANIESIIFQKEIFSEQEKNDEISNSGVFISQLESNSENKTMSSEKTNVNEEAVVETDCAQAADKAITLATDLTAKVAELEETNEKLLTKASENMKEQEKTVSDLQTSIDELKSQLDAAKAEIEASKAELETSTSDLEAVKAELETSKSEFAVNQKSLEEASETIAGYKKKEEADMLEKKMMKRKASLAECGFEEEEIEESLAAYDALDDEAFDRIIALQMNRMVKNKKKMEEEKDAEAAMPPALKEALEKKKKKESEAAADEAEAEEAEAADESVLDEVEVEEEVNLSVGSDNESEEDSTQAALVEFVRSRLTHK